MLKRILIIFLVLAIPLTIYLYPREETELIEEERKYIEKVSEGVKKDTLIYDKTPAFENSNYFEEIVILDDQPTYYAYPLEVIKEAPPKMIIYSHGQLQRIVDDLDDTYMLKIREYGEFFASKGYAFSASNQHDDNWGGQESLIDIQNSIEWLIENDFLIAEKFNLIGFSMGGKTAMNFALLNPEKINKVALLAPTPKKDITKTQADSIKNIPIKIWHGTADINIPFSLSQQYVEIFKNHGKNVELIPIENAQHFDIETSLMENLLEFFEN